MISLNTLSTLNPTTIALLSAFFGAIANILARTLLKDLKSKDILGINFLVMAALLLLVSPTFYVFKITFLSVALLLLIVIIDLCANYFYFKSFEDAEASYVTPLLSLTPLFAFIFSWLFIGEIIQFKQLAIALGILIAIIIFSYDFSKPFKLQKKWFLPLAASALFGLSAIPSKYLLTNLDVINPPTLYMLRAALIGIFAVMFFTSKISDITIKQFRIIIVRCVFVITQWILLYTSLKRGTVGVTMTLVNITPIFVFILGIFILKEKITVKKAITAALVVVLSLLL